MLKPHRDLGQSPLQNSPTSGSREQQRKLHGAMAPSPPSPQPPCPPTLHTLFVFNTPWLVRKKQKTHRTLFFILFPEKWANSQLQSLGEFPVWESGTCQEWKEQPASEASVVIGPNNNTNSHNHHHNKTCHVCTSAHTHAHRTQPRGQGFAEELWAAHAGGEACPSAPCQGGRPAPPSVFSTLLL